MIAQRTESVPFNRKSSPSTGSKARKQKPQYPSETPTPHARLKQQSAADFVNCGLEHLPERNLEAGYRKTKCPLQTVKQLVLFIVNNEIIRPPPTPQNLEATRTVDCQDDENIPPPKTRKYGSAPKTRSARQRNVMEPITRLTVKQQNTFLWQLFLKS